LGNQRFIEGFLEAQTEFGLTRRVARLAGFPFGGLIA
jgi:hypothetical protein